jgi:hypothetical protein
MAYIPKYILKRLVPSDSVKKVNNVIHITFVNVISPINVSEEFPDDLSGKIKVSIDEKPIAEEIIFNTELDIEGKTYKVTELNSLKGTTIPLGSKIQIRVPDKENVVQTGKTYKFSIWIYESGNLSFDIERTIN